MDTAVFQHVGLGNPKGPIVVMVAGFPDDRISAWNPSFLEDMKKKYHIYAFSMPDYEGPASQVKPWGYDFPQLVDGLHNSIVSLIGDKTEFHIIGHDWGAIMTQLYENKYGSGRVRKVVLLDVGQGLDPSPLTVIRIITYQFYFAFVYVVSQLVSFQLGNFLFGLFFVLCPNFLKVSTVDVIHRKDITVQLCYPYYYLWKGMLTGKMLKPKRLTRPTLYLYGTMKSTMFHSQKFLKNLSTTEGCRVKDIYAGHWVTHFQPDQCYQEISSFLQ
jgi:pimeloyl-ACP methyl ester carboxylesterase